MIEKSIKLLGLKATDRITGYCGTITSICFDLYGCVQAILTADVDDKGELKDGRWFDIGRLKLDAERRMDVPDFSSVAEPTDYSKGPATKSIPPRQ